MTRERDHGLGALKGKRKETRRRLVENVKGFRLRRPDLGPLVYSIFMTKPAHRRPRSAKGGPKINVTGWVGEYSLDAHLICES